MKRAYISIVLLALVLPTLVFAQENKFTDIINKVTNMVYRLALGIAVIFFIIAGVYFMTAQGEPGKIEKAKAMFVWTVIGLIVVLCSGAIVEFIKKAVLTP